MTDGVRTALAVHVALVLAVLGGLVTAGVKPADLTSGVWWAPVVVLNLGVFCGNLAALLLGRGAADARRIVSEARREDLEDSRRIVVEQLRLLDADRDKLSPEDYARERAELLAVGAAASRELEALSEPATSISGLGGYSALGPPTSPATAPPTLGPVEFLAVRLQAERDADPETFDLALARLGIRPATSGVSGEWRGAAYALAGVALCGLLFWFAGSASRERAPGSTMTGGDQVQPVAASADAPSDPCPPELRERLSRDPNDVPALNECTERAVVGRDLSTALQLNDRALTASPGDRDARVLRGVLLALVDADARDRALGIIDDVIAEDPRHLRALVYRGMLSMRSEPARAVEVLERALSIEDNPQVRLALAEARRQLGGDAAASAPVAPPAGGKVLAEGVVTLSPGAEARGAMVFVSLRAAGQDAGPPLGAAKLPAGPFPLAFRLTEEHLLPMARGRALPDRLQVTATLDVDGDAATKDGPTATLAEVAPGATGLEIVLR